MPVGSGGGVNPVAVAVGVGVLVALAYGGTQLRKAHRPDAGLAGRPVASRSGGPRPGRRRPGRCRTAGPGIAVRPEAELVGVGAGGAYADVRHGPAGALGRVGRRPRLVGPRRPGRSCARPSVGGPTACGPRSHPPPGLPGSPPAAPWPGPTPAGTPAARTGHGWVASDGPGAAPPAPGAEARAAGSATPASAWPFAGDPGAGPYRDDRSSGRPPR